MYVCENEKKKRFLLFIHLYQFLLWMVVVVLLHGCILLISSKHEYIPSKV